MPAPYTHVLGFDSHVTDSADEVVAELFIFLNGHDFDRVGLVMGTENDLIIGEFDVFDGTALVFADGVHVVFSLAIGSERVVMAVDEDGGAGQHARIHAHALAGVHLEAHEALPAVAVAFHSGTHAAEESLFKFEDFLDVHAHDERLSRGNLGISDDDAFKVVFAGRQNRSALVDFRWVQQVEHG